MIDTLWHDVRYGLRQLWHNPGFTAVVVLCLALGIGPNTTAFSLLNAVFFRPLDVHDPDRLVLIETQREGTERRTGFSYPLYAELRDRATTLEGMIACGGDTHVSVRWRGRSELAFCVLVSANFFDVLGRQALLGETFHAQANETPGSQPVVVFSHSYWEKHWHANPDVAGTKLRINSHEFTVLGVMPRSFTGDWPSMQPSFWVPLAMTAQIRTEDPGRLEQRGHSWLRALGRLRPDTDPTQVQAELDALLGQIAAEWPREHTFLSTIVSPFANLPELGRPMLYAITGLTGAVSGLLLLIACTSVAALLLARATTRRREIAVRLALGASRGRVIGQLLIENVLVALLAGGVALLLTLWTFDLIVALLPEVDFHVSLGSCLDHRVLGFALAVSVLTGVLFGLAPALQIARPDLIAALKDQDAGGGAAFRGTRMRNLFVVAQFAMALLLLIVAGLFVKGLRHARAIDPGFDAGQLLVLPVDLSRHGYKEESRRKFFDELFARLGRLPGVEAAAVARFAPLSLDGSFTAVAPVRADFSSGERVRVGLNPVSPGYFATMGIAVVGGREFLPGDNRGSPRVVVINETLARTCWPDEEAVGKSLMLGGVGGDALEIVGVVRDIKYQQLGEEPQPFLYRSLVQFPHSENVIHVRTAGEPAEVLDAVRQEIEALNADLPLSGLVTMREHMRLALWPATVAAGVFGVLGGLALLLAVISVFGVVSYSVTRRRREIGIRLALGGPPRDLVLLLVRQGLTCVGIGMVLGVAVALGVTRFLKGWLNGVSPTDAETFVGVPLVLAVVAFLAIYWPARRATRIDPMIVLRYE